MRGCKYGCSMVDTRFQHSAPSTELATEAQRYIARKTPDAGCGIPSLESKALSPHLFSCPRASMVSSVQREARLNFDVGSYQFDDLDLEIAARRLPRRDQTILILHLMGHKQRDIAAVLALSRSMISKRLGHICDILKELLITDGTVMDT